MKRVEAIVDGGMVGGNPGLGGWGGRFRVYDDPHSCDDTLVEERFLGGSFGTEEVTNNICEWRAVIGALQMFCEYWPEIEEFKIVSDSKLVVMQANGEWDCKDERMERLKQLYYSVGRGLRPCKVELVHRRREHTMVAHDHIAKILGRSK